jgi:Protein of unknown function (DUF1344)
MKKALLFFSTAFLLASTSMCLAAEEKNVSGVIKSIDARAHTITLEDGTAYPLKADADTAWLRPGNNVDLLCDHDAGTVASCGVGIGNLPEEALNATPVQPEISPDLNLDKSVDGVPENVLPDEPTYSLNNLLRALDEK